MTDLIWPGTVIFCVWLVLYMGRPIAESIVDRITEGRISLVLQALQKLQQILREGKS